MPKKSLRQVVKETGKIRRLTFDDFAYFDEKVNRWRAGKFVQTRRTGTFVSAKDAQRIRAAGSTAVYASRQAIRIARQNRDLTNEQAVELGYQWVREYRRTKRELKLIGVPTPAINAREYVDEIYNLEES